MVITHLNSQNPQSLSSLHPLLGKAFEEMARLLKENATDGCYKIDGDRLFINVMSYETKPLSEGLFEAHRDYIDIQMVISGEECIGFADLSDLTVCKPYEPDAELYSMVDSLDIVRISNDKLCIIFPDEPHAPGIAIGNTPSKVRKMVVKIQMAAN